ncbi:MAG: RDD family protein [Gammaproteobacteria bacterium]|nr:RDD family protein [Gammaproteobacteria bacterium]NIR97613.1 RDD family protein [Gammaproteobacteria bacterium]NIT63263.1 RDD family protein [Gammaproteobacteria bacterium]NIV20195.1 RDD family protein [Gammaproteobacteria bacterium]NIY31843.1 RDD family protein [Gammaproteobacteria bacterium]
MGGEPTRRSGAEQAPAGLLRRLGALFYDALLTFAVLFAATAAAMALSGGELRYASPAFRSYLVLVVFLFFGWFWTHGGQTLGMRAWRIRVQGERGGSIQWWQALIRFAAGVCTLGLGHLWLLLDRQGRSLYDLASRTRMVRVHGEFVPGPR